MLLPRAQVLEKSQAHIDATCMPTRVSLLMYHLLSHLTLLPCFQATQSSSSCFYFGFLQNSILKLMTCATKPKPPKVNFQLIMLGGWVGCMFLGWLSVWPPKGATSQSSGAGLAQTPGCELGWFA